MPSTHYSPQQVAESTHPQQRLGGLTGPLHGRMAGTCGNSQPHPEVTGSKRGRWSYLLSFLAGPHLAHVLQILLRGKRKDRRGKGPPEDWVHPQAGRPHGLAGTPRAHSPEVGFGELLHVELFIGEGCEVDVTNGGEHVSWEWGGGAGRSAVVRAAHPARLGRASRGP